LWISQQSEESRKMTAPYDAQGKNERFIKPMK
jgi:hypothetical protein